MQFKEKDHELGVYPNQGFTPLDAIQQDLELLTKQRVIDGNSSIIVDNIEMATENILVAELLELESSEKARHRLEEETGEITRDFIEDGELLLQEAIVGFKPIDGSARMLIEYGVHGSFSTSVANLKFDPRYHSDFFQQIKAAESVGGTVLTMNNPEEVISIIRPENAGQEVSNEIEDPISKVFRSILNERDTHKLELKIERDEWVEGYEMIASLLNTGIVERITVNRMNGADVNQVKMTDDNEAKTTRESVYVQDHHQAPKAIKRGFEKLE